MDKHRLRDFLNRLELRGRLVYATLPALSPGKVIMAEESAYSYAYVIFHDETEAAAAAQSVGLTLLHLRDAPRKPPTLDAVNDLHRLSIEDEAALEDRWQLRVRSLYGPSIFGGR